MNCEDLRVFEMECDIGDELSAGEFSAKHQVQELRIRPQFLNAWMRR